MVRRDARSDILRTAMQLFYAEGSRAIGVDRVIAEAAVAKASFYLHFPSKAALLIATLEARDADVRGWLCQAASERAAEKRIPPALAMFDIVAKWAAGDGFHGCGFLRAVFDSPDNIEARAIGAAHKLALENWIAESLAPDQRDKAAALTILLDGSVAQAFLFDDPGRIAIARRVAETLLGAP
ncbi:TetR/AcrR family transcriptional regulator [Sandarakinorhabdus sp. DWP1-3-1]|uniref:TetR/AcrR family transcriptional regulator n=1 Tax=Sandarakinorhabdus sp. DWP1-3-1 TaxID=2804627 RepID=UPI003CF7D097